MRVSACDADEDGALIAFPNLIDSELVDVWSLPSRKRLHAAIGKAEKVSTHSKDRTGMIMSLHLFFAHQTESESVPSSSKTRVDELRLLCGYENGGVTLRRYAGTDRQMSVDGKGWEVIWYVRLHLESVMAMSVSQANDVALTVSADNLIGRYNLSVRDSFPS